MSDFGKMMAPLARRLGNMLARGSVSAANGSHKMRTLQLRMMAGETKDDVEHFEPYGYTAEPHPGAEHISAFFDGDRSHGVTLIVADRRYRLTGLKAGEVALHDDLGQKVFLTRDGIVIDGANLPILIHNTPLFTVQADQIVLDAKGITGKASEGLIKFQSTQPDGMGGTIGGVVRVESAQLENTGDIRDRCDIAGNTIYQMHVIYNGHTHDENNVVSGPTDVPNQQM